MKCAQCHIEGINNDKTKAITIYDGMSLCSHHFDLKRARMIPTITPVDDFTERTPKETNEENE